MANHITPLFINLAAGIKTERSCEPIRFLARGGVLDVGIVPITYTTSPAPSAAQVLPPTMDLPGATSHSFSRSADI